MVHPCIQHIYIDYSVRTTVPGAGDPTVSKVPSLTELTLLCGERVSKDIKGQEEVIHAKEKKEAG